MKVLCAHIRWPILALGFITSLLHAQQLPLRQFTVRDGLPSNMVYNVTQDSRGVIWIGTDNGVVRYDGSNFQHYTTSDGLPTNDVYNVIVDKWDRIWLCMPSNQLMYFEKDELKKASLELIPIKETISSSFFTDIYTYDGEISLMLRRKEYSDVPVILGKDSVYIPRVPSKRWLDFQTPHEFVPYAGDVDKHTSVFNFGNQDQFFNIWSTKVDTFMKDLSSFTAGVYGKKEIRRRTIKNDQGEYYSLVLVGTKVFSVTKSGLSPWYFPQHPELVNDVGIIQLCRGNEGGYWLLSRGGKLFFLSKNKANLICLNQLNRYKINTIFPGSGGELWIATNGHGILKLEPDWQVKNVYTNEDGLISNRISCMAKTPDGKLYLGNIKPSFDVLDNGKIYQQPKLRVRYQAGAETFKDYSLLSSASGDLYRSWRFSVLNNNQLARRGEIFYSIEPSMESMHEAGVYKAFVEYPENVNAVSIFSMKDMCWYNNTTIIGAGGILGLYKLEKLSPSGFRVKMPFDPGQITTRSLSLKGDTIWCGEDGKLVSIIGDRLIDHPFPHLATKVRNGQGPYLWVGTEGQGLWSYNTRTDSTRRINIGEGSTIRDIVQAPDGSVWVADEQLVHHISGKPGNWQVRSHALANPLHRPTSLLVDSLVYVGSQQALYVMDPRKMPQSHPLPKLILNAFKANNQLLASRREELPEEPYAFPYNARGFYISWSGIAHWCQDHIRYQYRLLGESEEWQETRKNELDFFALPSGEYRFEVKAIDLWRQESEVLGIDFVVRPPWYLSWWFILIGLSALALGIWTYIRGYRRREQAKRLNSELQLKALQAQMNPHFIFNALTAIQAFVLMGDKVKANRYLARFAKLMRAYLKASSQKMVRVEQEIDMLEQYLALQALRMPWSFDYEIEVGEAVDLTAEIPALFLQPYVENGIQHGLLNKEATGRMWLRFKAPSSGKLLVEIEDDGVGRMASQALKAEGRKQHTSMGMSLIKDRKELLALMKMSEVTVEIIDLEVEAKPAGTLVRVLFQLQD